MENSATSLMTELMLYNNWANQQVLAACQTLDEVQLAATGVGAYGSIRDTLEHIMRAEADYAGRLGGVEPKPTFGWADRPSAQQMSEFAAHAGAALLQTVQNIQQSDMIVEHWDEGTVKYRALALFIQIINHGIEHRTNITTILVQQNLPAPEVDGWGYLWSHKDKFGASVTRKTETSEK